MSEQEQLNDLDMGDWEEELAAYNERNNLLIVDGLNLGFRYRNRGAGVGKPYDFAANLVSTVNSLAKSYGAREVIFLNDYKGSVYRKNLHPKYKSDRKLQYADQSVEEANDAADFFKYFSEEAVTLASQNFHLVQCEGVEADDLACYFVEAFEDGEHFDHIWLISTDGDWDELLSERCSRFSTTARKEYTLENFYECKGCDNPEQFTSIKAIMGDPGDSVYGVPGIGIKRAYNIVQQHGDVMTIVDNAPIEGKQKFITELNNSMDLIMLNLQLVDLRNFHIEAITEANKDNLNILNSVVEGLK